MRRPPRNRSLLAASVSRAAAGRFLKVVYPRRRWLLWTAAALAYCVLTTFSLVYFRDELRDKSGSLAAVVLLVLPFTISLLAAVAAPARLFGDLRANRLESILLTTMGRRDVLGKYHLSAFAAAAVVVVIVLLPIFPLVASEGREEAQWYCLLVSILWWSTASALWAASAFFATHAGLAAAVVARSRAWGAIAAVVLTAVFNAGLVGLMALINPMPGMSTVFKGATCIAVAWLGAGLLGRLLLSFAARRLDRLVTD